MSAPHDPRTDARDEQLRALRRQLDGEDVRDAARALLEPGEQLRELGEVGVAFGDTGPVTDAQPIELKPPAWYDRFWRAATRTTARKIVFFTLLAPVAALLALGGLGPPAVLDRLLGGRTCEGPRGSRARLVEHALSTLGPGANRLAVTDRRLLFVRQHLFRDPPRLTAVHSVALGEIAAAGHRPWGLSRRRVELRFIDGTRIVLALPRFGGLAPRRLLAALPRT